MSRNVLILSVAMLALSTLVVVSTIARPGTGNPVAEQTSMRPDFDRVFADAESVNLPGVTEVDREALRQFSLKRIEESRSGR